MSVVSGLDGGGFVRVDRIQAAYVCKDNGRVWVELVLSDENYAHVACASLESARLLLDSISYARGVGR